MTNGRSRYLDAAIAINTAVTLAPAPATMEDLFWGGFPIDVSSPQASTIDSNAAAKELTGNINQDELLQARLVSVVQDFADFGVAGFP